MKRARGPGGATLVDVVVAAFILGLLIALLFALLRSGVVGLQKVDNQTELLRELQLLSLRVTRESSGSNFQSLSVSTDERIVAFLSSEDANDNFQADEFGRPVWQKFVIYYYNEADKTVRRTEVPYTASDQGTARTLEAFSGQELVDFVGVGNPSILAKRVHACRWEVENPGFLVFEFRTEKKRYQAEGNESKILNGRVFLRN